MTRSARINAVGVILIVAILMIVAGLLAPFYPPRPRPSSCLDHERGIAAALSRYARDCDGRLPLYDNGSRPGYVTSAFGQAADREPLIDDAHPSDREGAAVADLRLDELSICPSDPFRPRMVSYTFNGLFLGQPLDILAEARDKILLVDECSVSDYVFLSYTAPNYTLHHMQEPGNFVHNSGLNCLYADGHAKWLNKKAWPSSPTDARFHAEAQP